MKSAHEDHDNKLATLVQAGLNKDPIDHEQLINCFSDENKFLAALLIGHILESRKKSDEILEVVINNSKDNKVSIVNISRLFVLYPNLLEHYDYDLELNCITYDGVELPKDSPELTYLSIDLEQYFGTKDIPHKDLLVAIKRYFLRIHKENRDINQQVEIICKDYLAGSKTKKRTRIPQKHLRANIDLPLNEIKNIMALNGYVEWKYKNNCVHFYKVEA